MRSEFVFAVLVLLVAVVGVRLLDERHERRNAAVTREAAADVASGASDLRAYYAAVDQEVRVARGAHDQFFVTAHINRNPAEFLVDTGASYVALRESDAAAAGVFTQPADYSHVVRTANGETRAALVTLRSIEVEGLRVDDVRAFILPDEQLGMNLLGMSYLSRLKSVEARGGELVLKG
ncbi:MAG: TIGR02281 family clan AA aspartic protease [Alphaproteobacteria bacterium]|nr:TIGR02281 family clan AA aspartic protease [Alphaproteobacteria bacterium]